jgi:glucose-6-phosphate 1-dehydrogenase
MRPLRPEDIVRGQYTRNQVNGTVLPGYREEEGVRADSTTETFVAAKLFIDNWRWAGVPFYLCTGKRLSARRTQAVVSFRGAPLSLFRDTGAERMHPNDLVIDIQPAEAINYHFVAKAPGPDMAVVPVEMRFDYTAAFGGTPPEAYERLLHDAMEGDSTLFARADSVERAWEVVEPVLEGKLAPLHFYPAGTWGPHAADELIAPREWHKS